MSVIHFHAGVFHVEGPDRYSLTLDLAKKLCESLGITIASREQVIEAHAHGLETCRYGWISNGNTTILRQKAHVNCANNTTGVFFHQVSPEKPFDAFCFNASGPGFLKASIRKSINISSHIGDNISLGADPSSVLWNNSNVMLRFEWRKLIQD
uniref:CD44 antigen n=1 Tax=Oncorhynchus kisutch TaxID=8019 RepID=A0A8C7CX21_ONCKI